MTRQVQHEASDPRVLVLPQWRDGLPVVVDAAVGVDDGLVQECPGRGGQVGVHHPVVVVGHQLALEDLGERRGRHPAFPEVVQGVVHGVELDLQDHPEQSVAPDHGSEQLGVVAAVDLPDGAVREHQADRAHGGREAAGAEVGAMGVDRDGAADAEYVDAGHRGHRETLRVGGLEDVSPGCTGADAHRAPDLVDRDPVHVAHVQDERTRERGLAAHAVLGPGHRDGKSLRACECEGLTDLVVGAGPDHPVHGRAVEAAGVVDGSTVLAEPVRWRHVSDGSECGVRGWTHVDGAVLHDVWRCGVAIPRNDAHRQQYHQAHPCVPEPNARARRALHPDPTTREPNPHGDPPPSSPTVTQEQQRPGGST